MPDSLIDVAWVLTDDPDPDTKVHRVDLATGKLVCADWVPHTSGYRIPDREIKNYGPRCVHCWPEKDQS